MRNGKFQTLGHDTGKSALTQLTLPFHTFVGIGSKVATPSDFFDDLYTSSYALSFVNTMRVHIIGDKGWSESNIAEFLMSALRVIDPRLNDENLGSSWMNTVRNSKSVEVAMQGSNAATALVLLMFGKIDEKYDDPLIRTARLMADKREDDLKFLSPTNKENSVRLQAMVSALHEGTIGSHMRNRYPNIT